MKRDRTTENEIGDAILRIANDNRNRIATYPRIREELPLLIDLSREDRCSSVTRPGEELWEQIVRNIKSNSTKSKNYIFDGYLEHVPRIGYRITPKGESRLKFLEKQAA